MQTNYAQPQPLHIFPGIAGQGISILASKSLEFMLGTPGT